LRLAQGLTLEELCLRAGLVSATPKSRMWEIENGTRKEGLRFGTLFALAHALGVEASDLLPSVAEALCLADISEQSRTSLALNGE
jgi:transcriptional regulator with XRE-family HTH domain